MKYFIFVVLVILLLFGCDPVEHRESVKKTIDRTELPIEVRVYFYESVEEVTEAYRNIHGIDSNIAVPMLYGFASWPQWYDADSNPVELKDQFWCEIHSIQPINVNDQGTLTLGHEMLHCLYGTYHQ